MSVQLSFYASAPAIAGVVMFSIFVHPSVPTDIHLIIVNAISHTLTEILQI